MLVGYTFGLIFLWRNVRHPVHMKAIPRFQRLIVAVSVRFVFVLLMGDVSASVPAPDRTVVPLPSDWRFVRQDVALTAPVVAWDRIDVPHTWNARDGQDGATPGNTARPFERGSDYYRGVGWYAKTLDLPAEWRGRRVFVLFEAASQHAVVYANGTRVGEHTGGFTAFCCELTSVVRFGGTNELRVRVDNTLVKTIPPLAGDFNVEGGLYRPVHLLVTDAVCISPLESASPGVFLTPRRIDDAAADVEIKTLLSNGGGAVAALEIETRIFDASGAVVASARTPCRVERSVTAQALVQQVTVPRPHRWHGRRDPYLYGVTVRLLRDGQAIDTVTQPLGLRSIALDADGFRLNGERYPVYGVCRHQDARDRGWALAAADDERDIELIADIGATAVRLAHYPQGESFHTLSDRTGLLLWNEVPFVNEVPDPTEPTDTPSATTQAFNAVLETEMREMILQRYNHPSAIWWGLFNELRPGAMCQSALAEVKRLNALAHTLDPTRPTVGASDRTGNPTNFVADAMAYNVYPGWYTGTGELGEMAALIDEQFAEQHGRRVALSEYGAGGNPSQHLEGSPTKPGANNAPFHPEEWQALMHERDWAQIADNPKLWGSFVWVMFDFASDGRNEGSQPGVNDKGLVTMDRKVTKDAYHFYHANWSPAPVLYIASRRAAMRQQASTEIKVYTNAPSVELLVNGRSLGRSAPDAIRVARWTDVVLQPGGNIIEARGVGTASAISDRCEWELVAPANDDSAVPPSTSTAAPDPTAIRVACVGDSITAGSGTVSPATDAYPAQLQRLLGDGYRVGNFGVSGATLLNSGDKPYRSLSQFRAALEFLPEVVVILLGTNDTKEGNWRDSGRFVADYVELVRAFKALPSSPRIVVCAPPIVAADGRFGINEAGVKAECPLIAMVAQREQVDVIDLHAAFAGRDALLPDFVHPNNEGAQLIGRTILPAVAAYKRSSSLP